MAFTSGSLGTEMPSKIVDDATAALAGHLHDAVVMAAGGFGPCGLPENLLTRGSRHPVPDYPVGPHLLPQQSPRAASLPASQPANRDQALPDGNESSAIRPPSG